MIRIATRRSALAQAQAFQTGRLMQRRTGEPFELVPMATSGDLAVDVPVDQVDVKGMFVDTIRRIAPCGVFRPTLSGCTPGPSFSSSSGKSMSCTSTSPGSM